MKLPPFFNALRVDDRDPRLRYRYFFKIAGCPIRTSTDQSLFATPRNFSQLTTSFVASESLGIPCMPLLTSLRITRVRTLIIRRVRPVIFTCYL
jgi:hypothetical protein